MPIGDKFQIEVPPWDGNTRSSAQGSRAVKDDGSGSERAASAGNGSQQHEMASLLRPSPTRIPDAEVGLTLAHIP